MANDIVQTIKLEVEGGEEAAAALEKVGESSTASFAETEKAAETAGVSIEDFAKLSEKTQQAYIELSKGVEKGSQSIIDSTKEVQQAASGAGAGTKDLGGGLDQVSEKSGVSSREMRGLGKIMKELGAGEAAGLAVSLGKIASSLGILGAAALALAMAAGHIATFAKETADAEKAMQKLANATQMPVGSLKELQQTLAQTGMSTKQFTEEFSNLALKIATGAPKLGSEIADAFKQAIDAQHAYETAVAESKSPKFELQTAQLRMQGEQLQLHTQQLQLQGQQLAQNLQSVRLQLSYLDQMQALESQRAGLAVQDAQANLRMLELKRALLHHTISQNQYDRAIKREESEGLDRAIEKARLDIENAEHQKEILQEQQQAQRRGLKLQEEQLQLQKKNLDLQQQQLPIQMEQLALQREQNELAKRQAKESSGADIAAAWAKANEALANSFAPVNQQIAELKQILLDASGVGANLDLNKLEDALAKLYDKATALQKLRLNEELKKWVPPEVIKSIQDGSEGLAKFRKEAARIAWATTQMDDFGKAADISAGHAKNIGTVLAGFGIIALKAFGGLERAIVDPIIAAAKTLLSGGSLAQAASAYAATLKSVVTELGSLLHRAIDPMLARYKERIEFFTRPVANAWQWIKDKWDDIVDWINEKIVQAETFIEEWVTTPVVNAWQWIKDKWDDIVDWINEKIVQAETFIEEWVTTPVANAWQWIKDIFGDAVQWVSSKIDEIKALVTAWVTTPVANAWQWIKDMWNANVPKFLQIGGGDAAGGVAAGAATQGAFASGGLLGGRGTGTSDSNLVWVSRGEHIMPARAVQQPGVLAFLEALRLSGGNLRAVLDGMGRFALGGMVRAPISIPALAGGRAMNNVTIQFPGLPEITGLRASSGVVDELRKAAAMAQVRSGGRKPSRYS